MDDELNDILYTISHNESVNFLRYKPYHLERDILRIISVVFNIESAIKLGYDFKIVEIEVSEETFNSRNIAQLAQELTELIEIVLLRQIEIKFIRKDFSRGKWDKKVKFEPCENICLFSGGVDSLTGILSSAEHYKELCGVFIAHADQPWIIHIVNSLIKKIQKKHNINLYTIHAPPMMSEGYSQLRGFLYIALASIYANLLQSKRILVTECGVTMYQPRFSPFDTITMTTHPFVMKKAKTIIQLLLNRDIEIVTPFENLTKAEIALLSTMPELFKDTHSCISQRMGTSEGTCYGCITRRLGLITAGVPDTTYDYNPLIEARYNQDHLLNLLRFCTDILFNYDELEYYSKENIETYDKYDLFKRFALDVFCALHVLRQNGNISPYIEQYYENAIREIGAAKLDSIIAEIREKKIRPDFNKKVE